MSSTTGWWDRRWDGRPGRLEVWYATFTDRRTGTGFWVHGETVAPAGGGEPHRVAWAALFPADAAPSWHRIGPQPGEGPVRGFECDGLSLLPGGSEGRAGQFGWDLRWDEAGQHGIATFGRPAWDRGLLPAAQVVPCPDLEVTGWVDDGTTRHTFDDAHGQCARIYGHGNAQRWAWLHADLGGGDLVELVTAVSTRPVLDRLPPVCFVRFRIDGRVWPAAPLPSLGLRTRLALPSWQVSGRIGRARVRIDVTQPPERNVAIDYADPDGRTATCTNTERADLRIRIDDPRGIGDHTWSLDGTAHAEVGTRP